MLVVWDRVARGVPTKKVTFALKAAGGKETSLEVSEEELSRYIERDRLNLRPEGQQMSVLSGLWKSLNICIH